MKQSLVDIIKNEDILTKCHLITYIEGLAEEFNDEDKRKSLYTFDYWEPEKALDEAHLRIITTVKLLTARFDNGLEVLKATRGDGVSRNPLFIINYQGKKVFKGEQIRDVFISSSSYFNQPQYQSRKINHLEKQGKDISIIQTVFDKTYLIEHFEPGEWIDLLNQEYKTTKEKSGYPKQYQEKN